VSVCVVHSLDGASVCVCVARVMKPASWVRWLVNTWSTCRVVRVTRRRWLLLVSCMSGAALDPRHHRHHHRAGSLCRCSYHPAARLALCKLPAAPATALWYSSIHQVCDGFLARQLPWCRRLTSVVTRLMHWQYFNDIWLLLYCRISLLHAQFSQ